MNHQTAPSAATQGARMSTEDRREQLLTFGRTYFAEHGYDASSMAEIARAAGVSKGLLYHYFGGRHGFYVATIERVADEVLAATVPPTEVDLASALHGMLVGFVTYVRDNAPIYLALVRGGLGADSEVSAQLDRVRRTSVARVVARAGLGGLDDLGARATIAMFGWVSFVETATATWLETEGVSSDELVALLSAAIQPVLTEIVS